MLPNITLGYHAFDSCGDVQRTLKSVMKILSRSTLEIPNYSCSKHGKVAGVIGDQYSLTTLHLAQFLNVYRYTQICGFIAWRGGNLPSTKQISKRGNLPSTKQISYGATDPLLSDRALYPFFFRTVQDDRTHYAVILKFLQHFGWNWVGIITSKDESGEKELQELSHEITSHGICIEFIVKMSSIEKENDKDLAVIRKSTTQVLITCGTCSAPCFLIFQNSESLLQNITIIVKASWTYVLYFNIRSGKTFNGSLSISPPMNPIPGVNTLIHKFHPSNRPNDPLLEDIWLMNLNCLSPNLEKNNFFQYLYKFTANNCTGKERIRDKISVPQNPVYNAVYILAHTLHNMHSSLASLYPEIDLLSYKYLNLVSI
ncbi:Hypothetical predicted protein [Pelobates cultripes]|uniref:Receptor ligand binding region domain-containing protein n=1 Tax=Pelobates cultripes TaxID=61616 RepID=A0AAD1SG42_PELCU|nr:Hypothetical predicted protein [Pelobates cultripes]